MGEDERPRADLSRPLGPGGRGPNEITVKGGTETTTGAGIGGVENRHRKEWGRGVKESDGWFLRQ